MTTEEILWNAAFERDEKPTDDSYNYAEELAIEKYHEDKELFDRYTEYFRQAG